MQPITQSLHDIYNSTDEAHMICLLADAEDLKFEKVVLDEKWKKAMNEEIDLVEKNDT